MARALGGTEYRTLALILQFHAWFISHISPMDFIKMCKSVPSIEYRLPFGIAPASDSLIRVGF